MKRRNSFLIAWLAWLCCAGRVPAADSPFVVDVWGTAAGLPQSSVIALTQTREGYLWLGTLNGLVRFDGNSFTRFNVNNTPGLPDNRIIFLFEDRRTNLWVGTEGGGLCAIKDGVVKNFDAGSAPGKITFAYEDESGTIWFSAADGKFLCWKNGRLESNPQIFSAQLFYRAARLSVPGRNGVVWRLQGGRVEKRRGERLEKSWDAVPWANARVSAAMEDREGNLVVATLGSGVFWLDSAGNWRPIGLEQGLSHNTVLAATFDREGNLWAGTDGGGLNRIRKKSFSVPAGLHPWVAKSAADDAQGNIWVTYNGQGLSCWRTNAAIDYGIGAAGNAWSVLVDRRQQVWAGTSSEGLFRFAAGHFQPVAGAEKIGLQIFALFEARNGTIWAGGQNGLAGFDGAQWRIFSSPDGLPPNSIRALAEDVVGNLWIGTEGGGLFRLHDGKVSNANAPVKDVSCLLVDRDGVLWVGSSGHGLAHWQNEKWTVCSTLQSGLVSDSISYLLEDDAGNLWLGSYEGLLRISKKSVADFAAGAAKTIACRTFFTRECSAGAQPAAVRTQDGKMWFPTIGGLLSVNPAELNPNPNPPPVVIESVVVDGVEQNSNRLVSLAHPSVTLTPASEQLEIHFTTLNFSAPKGAQFGARFKFRLEGRDKTWTDIGGERVAHFNKINPGRYLFRVIACNEDGVWNDSGATLAVTVEPPFWRTLWFVAAAVLLLLGALAGIIYLLSTARLKRQLRAARQKELIERERARIARDLHDQLGANLTQVTLLGELAQTDKHLPAEVELHAQQIIETARDTTRSLDEIVWAVNPANDTLEGLANYVCKYAQDYFELAGVSYRAGLPVQLPATPIPPEVRHNVFLAFKEAVNNVVKHAHATEARVSLSLVPGKFVLTVADNGCGVGDVSDKKLRNGLNNMRKRLADIRGEFELLPGAGGGTVVKFTVSLAAK